MIIIMVTVSLHHTFSRYRSIMIDLSSKSLGLWAGLETRIPTYFDRRRSHPDFKGKLRENRKADSRAGGGSSGPQLPDFSNQEAVQRGPLITLPELRRFSVNYVQLGEELLATGILPRVWSISH